MDDADFAQLKEDAARARALDGVRAAARMLSTALPGNVLCGCGDPIEEARRRAVPGAKTCIACALAAERRAKLFRSAS